ncbi:hypothetical protein [Streptomyces sp. NBC_01520]|uniref:hypothetical protein n=1 Tax=Streptomyces sp. NBC_01520 TaxID=2903892 RepID=UPI0038676A42
MNDVIPSAPEPSAPEPSAPELSGPASEPSAPELSGPASEPSASELSGPASEPSASEPSGPASEPSGPASEPSAPAPEAGSAPESSAVVPEPAAPAPEPPAVDPTPEPSAVLPDAPAPARSGKVRRILLTALPAVLVIGAIGGAAAYTKITVDDADRTVTTTVWSFSGSEPGKDPAGDTGAGRADTPLAELLLPVPDDYRLGPDIRELGNDGEVSGKQATATMKESNRGLAGKERREYDKRIDKLRVQGLAVRSYVSQENDLVVNAEVMRMKDKKAVRDFYTFRTELFDAIGVFRDGPKVTGYTRKATCHLPPKDSKSKLETLVCSAYDGELSITYTAFGAKPFDGAAVAGLLKDQLDHITSPGEYV